MAGHGATRMAGLGWTGLDDSVFLSPQYLCWCCSRYPLKIHKARKII